MQPLVFIVPGHGRRGGRFDPGAVSGGVQEADSVRVITEPLAAFCRAGGAEAVIDGEDHYPIRHRRLAELLAPGRRCAVVHLHHNAAGGSARYALAMHDRRSTGGAELARLCALELGAIPDAPWGTDCRVIATYDDRAAAGDRAWLHRAHGCYDEVWAMPAGVSAVLLEYGFITHAPTRAYLDDGGRAELAEATADAVLSWLGL